MLESTSEVLGDGLKIVDVKDGDGPEPQIGEKIKVLSLFNSKSFPVKCRLRTIP